MKRKWSYISLFLIAASFAGGAPYLCHRARKLRADHCEQVPVKESGKGCRVHDGTVECYLDFLQPESWGRCLKEKDGSLLCMNHGQIAHYSTEDKKEWELPVKDCPTLARQIEQDGQPAVQELPIEIAAPPAPRPRT